MFLNGANKMEGLVKVCFGGAWGTICGDIWSEKAASVVCRQLNYSMKDAPWIQYCLECYLLLFITQGLWHLAEELWV